jgi:hypothetical protein
LKLLRRAAARLHADSTLAQLHASYAAFAAVMTKGGHRVFEKFQSALKKHRE